MVYQYCFEGQSHLLPTGKGFRAKSVFLGMAAEFIDSTSGVAD